MSVLKKPILGKLLIIFFSAFILYVNTFSHEYAWDDKIVVEKNQRVQKGISGIPDLFVKYNSQYQYDKYGYRPITLVSLAIEYQIAPGNAHFSHFMNVFYFSILCVLIFIFLIKLFSNYNWLFSFLITLLFVTHPLHVEVVANIKSRDEILALLFAMLAFIFFIRYMNDKKPIMIFYTFLFYFLAYLSKENSITLLAVFPIIAFIKKVKLNKKLVLISGVSILICAAASFLIYTLSINSKAGVEASMGKGIYEENGILGNSFFHLSGFGQKLPNAIHVLGLYLKNFIIPYPLLFYYGYNVIPVTGWGNFAVIVSLLIHIVLLVVGIKFWKKRPEILFGFLFYAICISVYTHLFRTLSDTMSDRFLFFGSLGLCIMLIGLLGLLLKTDWNISSIKNYSISIRFKELVQKNKTITYSTLVVCIVLSFLTFSRNKVWKDDMTLVKHDLPYLENCSRVNYYYATLLNKQLLEDKNLLNNAQKRLNVEKEMIKYYEKSIKISDYAYNSYVELGSYYCMHYRYEEGIKVFEKAVQLFPDAGEPHFYLGQSYVLTNRPEKGVSLLEKSIEKSYNQPTNYYFLGIAYSRVKRFEDAVNIINKGLEKFENEKGLFYDAFGFIYFENGQLDKSIEYTMQLKNYGKPEKDVYSYIIGRCYAAGDSAKGNMYLKEAQMKGIQF